MAGIFISCFPIFPPNMSGISVPGSFFFTGLYIILKSVVGVQPVFLAVWYTIFYGSSSNFLANLPSLEAVSQKVVRDPPPIFIT